MSKCYVLGAGFSKAIADLPVMREMVCTFARILKKERDLGHENRVKWGDRLMSYLNHLETEFFQKPCVDANNGQTYEACNFKENLEALVSFIDLNMSGAVHATLIDIGGGRTDFTKRSLFWNHSDLAELRLCIQTYLYLALIGPFELSPVLRSFIDKVQAGDSLLTFNYDLIVEKALYDRRLWYPLDGYGVEFAPERKVAESRRFKTQVSLYKLHGSLNWDRSTQRLRLFYDDGLPIFPGCLEDESSPLAASYKGKHEGNWLMPSFMKEFSKPGLLSVWTKAINAVRQAEEVVIIGYSLPAEDSAASLLLGTSELRRKRVRLVNPDADNLRARYMDVTGNKEIISHKTLEDYLQRAEQGY